MQQAHQEQQQQQHHQLHQQQQQLYARLDTQLKPPQPPKKRSLLSSSSSSFAEQNIEYAQKMQQQQQKEGSSRLGTRNTGGVIVEVQGGHIVRSTGRKDRHSKVCTAKGPRDRRVRLSAHTAIQFYDVQDRLGYDRPSKAVDWLIKKAKASIDGLAELPAWNPTTGSISTNTLSAAINSAQQEQQEQQLGILHGGGTTMATGSENVSSDYAIRQHHRQEQEQMESAARNNNNNNQSFLPPSLDSDAIADTIKSFFPMDASAGESSNAMHFQNYHPRDLLSRTGSHSQDLRLSLQSFQDPMLIQSHHHQGQTHHHNHHHQGEEHGLFSGTNPLGFDSPSSGWPEHHQPADIGRFQRMIAWNSGADPGNGSGNVGGGGGGGGGFMFDSPPSPPQQQQQQQQPFLQQLFGQSQFFSQRGPLQSSNTSSIRAWIDSPMTDHHQSASIHPSTISGFGGYASGDFSGFRIPARIQGEEDHDDGISNKPLSSASSDSRH